ncbi:hypothetical protein evm_010413 [Chilo suppressalis]|nr:hypothetical protein evm_010413 [Chilo suppressalis]
MKTLTVLFLYIVFGECKYSPIEVFEIKETNERHPQLYVKNVNDLEDVQGAKSSLSKLLRPYKMNRDNIIDTVTKNLLDKLEYLKNHRAIKNSEKGIYLVNANLLNDGKVDDSEEEDSFSDDTRSGRPTVLTLLNQLLSLKNGVPYKLPAVHTALRSYDNNYRTAPPRHRYLYDNDRNN